jgi:cyanophycinase
MMRRFVDLAGGAGVARIAVIPLASGEPPDSSAYLVAEFRALGADAVLLDITRANADSPALSAVTDSSTGVWFGGGDQIRITSAILGTRFHTALLRRYRQGAVIGGTSAGAAIMSDSMLTGRQRPPGDTLGYYGDTFSHVARSSIEIVPGLGFLPGTIIDQHFIRRERHNRLLGAVLERPSMVGIGIDEATAVIVKPNGEMEVFGRSAAAIYDARRAHVTPPGKGPLGASEVRVHLVSPGGTFNLRTGRVALPH